MWVLVLQRIVFDWVVDFFYFPLWWYTFGVQRAALFCIRVFRLGNARLAPWLWLKNIFVPMYGQRDWQGRITSFFIRLVNVLIRGAFLLVWFIISLALFVLWLALPALVMYLFFISLARP